VPDSTLPWSPGTATGLGPFPGTDPGEAARVVFGQLDRLPYLPALPARGVGSDAVGRTAALLHDLHVDLVPSGWRLVARPGVDERRARTALRDDLDALEEAAEGYEGACKVHLVGPWTLAANLELPRGEKALLDDGAVGDLIASLAEGFAGHLAEIRRRLGRVGDLVVQLDEPLLAAVLFGELPTASGWGRLRGVEAPVVEDGLRRVMAAGGDDTLAGVRANVADPPIAVLHRAGARFLGIDAELLAGLPEDDVGEAIEAGMGLLVGTVPVEAVPVEAGDRWDPRPGAEPVRGLWRKLTLPPEDLGRAVAVTPHDGLEQVAPEAAARILGRAGELARFIEEVAGEGAA
jgi:Cobalamin-independent synthase, Catalytic domain